MNRNIPLTPERVDALQAVDLRLFGVTHGITEFIDGLPYVRQCEDEDYAGLLTAASHLRAEHGDVLVVEPTGFARPQDEELTLTSIVPANIPETPVADMSQDFRDTIAVFLEKSREERRINNLVYVAAHTMLRGIPVRRADTTVETWVTMQDFWQRLDPDVRKEKGLFYRNTRMLAALGDAAIEMTKPAPGREVDPTGDARPILLLATGSAHSPRLGKRLDAAGVPYETSILPRL